MFYMYSQATANGQRVTVRQARHDLDKAQVLVQNRVAVAEPGCPKRCAQRRRTAARRNSQDLIDGRAHTVAG